MIQPIVCYGNSILKEQCVPIIAHDFAVKELIIQMWETLENAQGCGLAASQINRSVKLFIVNTADTYQNMDIYERGKYFDGDRGIRETFINAEITEYGDDIISTDEEGCLSIPGISGTVNRPRKITIRYFDMQFNEQIRTYSGYTARVIQHEYDHTCGILYIDRQDSSRKCVPKNELSKIRKGMVHAKYPMIQ